MTRKPVYGGALYQARTNADRPLTFRVLPEGWPAGAMLTHTQLTESTPIFDPAQIERFAQSDADERQLALEYLAEAWNSAEEDGVETQALAHASLFAALATLVKAHGEVATAELVAALPDRIRAGEYNLDRSLQ